MNVYENPAIATFSSMKTRTRFRQRMLRRGTFDTPLGVLRDWIARFEAQQRQNLHEHIPYMCEPCSPDCQSRSRYCIHNPCNILPDEIHDSAHDNVRKMKHHAYVQAELVRPFPTGHVPPKKKP